MDVRGKKHVCPGCGAMFYDMNKLEACPRCGKALDSREEIEAIRRRRRAAAAIPEPKLEPDVPADPDELEVTDTEVFFDDLGDGDDRMPKGYSEE